MKEYDPSSETLVDVSEGPPTDALKSLINRLGIDGVHIVGVTKVERADAPMLDAEYLRVEVPDETDPFRFRFDPESLPQNVTSADVSDALTAIKRSHNQP